MAKFHNYVGYVKTEETRPGVWEPVITEKKYFGDFNRFSKHWSNGTKVNSDLSIRAEVSIVADPYLISNMHTIRYVVIDGTPWEVSSIEPNHPRLILNLGGVYNGERPGDEQIETP